MFQGCRLCKVPFSPLLTLHKNEVFIKDSFSKCDQIRRTLSWKASFFVLCEFMMHCKAKKEYVHAKSQRADQGIYEPK